MMVVMRRRAGTEVRRRIRVCQVLLLVLFGAALARPEAAHGVPKRVFSDPERRSLEAGDLVQRPASERRGELRLIGGTSYQVIDAPPSVVWQALTDTPNYPRMLPRVLEARVVRQQPGERQVFMRQGQEGLLEAAYYLNVVLDKKRGDITFRMAEDRPHDLRAAWGFYNIRRFESGRTLLSYGIMADIGSGMFTSLVRDAVQNWMLRTPWMVKRFVEGSGRWLYTWP